MTTRQNPKQSDFEVASLKRNPSSPRTLFGLIMSTMAGLLTLLAIVPLFIILTYLLVKGISSLSLASFIELPPPPLVDGGGFGNAILGTVIMVGIGALISVPLGIMAAIYLSEFNEGKAPEWIRFATNVLSGVPSIIIGVFAYSAIVLTTKTYSAWAGGFALAILMLPIIVRTTEESLKLVPQEVRQASVGIGANQYQTVLQVVLPALMDVVTKALMSLIPDTKAKASARSKLQQLNLILHIKDVPADARWRSQISKRSLQDSIATSDSSPPS